jgi:hypothetical protein
MYGVKAAARVEVNKGKGFVRVVAACGKNDQTYYSDSAKELCDFGHVNIPVVVKEFQLRRGRS